MATGIMSSTDDLKLIASLLEERERRNVYKIFYPLKERSTR